MSVPQGIDMAELVEGLAEQPAEDEEVALVRALWTAIHSLAIAVHELRETIRSRWPAAIPQATPRPVPEARAVPGLSEAGGEGR